MALAILGGRTVRLMIGIVNRIVRCLYPAAMSRASALLAALTSEPASTSELYARVGYLNLTRVGLIPYEAFRAELVKLSAAGLAESDIAEDGSTMWRLATSLDEGPTLQ
jgi:hypothetical protein